MRSSSSSLASYPGSLVCLAYSHRPWRAGLHLGWCGDREACTQHIDRALFLTVVSLSTRLNSPNNTRAMWGQPPPSCWHCTRPTFCSRCTSRCVTSFDCHNHADQATAALTLRLCGALSLRASLQQGIDDPPAQSPGQPSIPLLRAISDGLGPSPVDGRAVFVCASGLKDSGR